MTFASHDTVVLGDYRDMDPANADLLDRHAATLSRQETPAGSLKVVRIPMPPRGADHFGGTYTNVIFANGVLLVPTWPEASQELEAEAISVYRRLLPGWEVVGINCRELAIRNGGLHCVAMNLHRLPQIVRSVKSSTRRTTL